MYNFTNLKDLIVTALETTGAEVGALVNDETISWVDIGKAVADLSADDMKNLTREFALGVIRTIDDTKIYKRRSYGIIADAMEYDGVIQYVATNFAEVGDNKTRGLVSGTDYGDFVYHGVDKDVRLQTKEEGAAILWSMPDSDLKEMFTNEESANRYANAIMNAYYNTYNAILEQKAKTLLCDIAINCKTVREIKLITLYNAEVNPTPTLTINNWRQSDDFKRWAKEKIELLTEYIRDITDKYNDTGVKTFTDAEDVNITLLTAFDKAIKNIPNLYDNNTPLNANYTINYWQESGDEMLPTLATVGTISVTEEGDDEPTVTPIISNVVGLIYDKYAGKITTKQHKVTSQYVHRGDFTNYADNIVTSTFYNRHHNAIVLTLS